MDSACGTPSLYMSASSVKVYHTHPASSEWKYYGLRGILIFCTEPDTDLAFRLVACDSAGACKIIWTYKVHSGSDFVYHVDGLPSFHWFHGLTRKYGILFENDDDAETFARAVLDRSSRPESPTSTLQGDARRRKFMSSSALSLSLMSTLPELPRRSTLPKRSGSRIWSLRRNRSVARALE